MGEVTLMCGDGTNDMGALKKAHVGISLMNNPELEQRINMKHQVSTPTSSSVTGDEGSTKKSSLMKTVMEAEAVAEIDRMDPTLIQLGDASLASPFTAKSTSVDCVLTVIRQGRTSLVTTIQVYKILALNCLVSAFMLSTLYLYGVKQGDTQMTILGLFIASLFYLSSVATPLEHLSSQKPNKKLFCSSVIMSIVGQSAVHIFSLLQVVEMSKPYAEVDDGFAVPDGEFRPNLLNSLIFILSCWVQLNTFAVNYCGYPFTTPLKENKYLWRILLVGWFSVVFICLHLIPYVNDYISYYLELVPLPIHLFPTDYIPSSSSTTTSLFPTTLTSSFRLVLVGILCFNLITVCLIERVARQLN